MALPIVFFHYGNADYLKYTLKQARYFNPDSAIYLLGDSENNRYPFLTHISASKYDAETETFTKLYKHLSPNDAKYELNCFLRWFYIRAFCRDHNIQAFIYLDSDVLAFHDLSELVPLFKPCKIANTCEDIGSPAVTYFHDYQTINKFCDYLNFAYSDKTSLSRIENLYKDPYNIKFFGGISDMTLFHLYDQDHPGDTLKVDLINDKIAVDVSINRVDGYEMDGGMKKIYWQKGLPYCRNLEIGSLIKFATLHYQGNAKAVILKHYKAGGYITERLWTSVKGGYKQVKKGIRK